MQADSHDTLTEDYQKMRREALSLEARHLEIRKGLRDTEAALKSDPGNEELKVRLEELKTNLEKLNLEAPWINSDMPTPYLRGTTSGAL
jgi:hypothetical protein